MRGGEKKSFQKRSQTQSMNLFYFLVGNKIEIMLKPHSFHVTIGLGQDKSNSLR